MYTNIKQIMEEKQNPFFHIHYESGHYSTNNQESYYAKKLPDETFSYDVSNNKVLSNVDEFGGIKLVTFYRNHYTSDDIPGVWVCKDFGQAGPFAFGMERKGSRVNLKEAKVDSDLMDNLFVRVIYTGEDYRAMILSYAPVSGDGSERLSALVYGMYVENTGRGNLKGAVVLPDFSPGKDYFTMPDVSGEVLDVQTAEGKVEFCLEVGEGIFVPVILYGPGENKDVEKIRQKGWLYWLNETRKYFRGILGELTMPGDEMTAYLFERAVYQGISAIGMNRDGQISGSNWGTFPATRQIWMKDMYYSYLPLSMLYPEYFKKGCLWFLENGIRPKGARYEGGIKHSLSNSMTAILMAVLYYENTGDRAFFKEEKVYERCCDILEETWKLRGEECSLLSTVWISDALALGKYHTGSNICAWKAFSGMGRIAKEVFEDTQRGEKYIEISDSLYADIEKYMVVDGTFGRQYLEGIGGLSKEDKTTYSLSHYDVPYVDQAKVFYPDIIKGNDVNLLMHDGEESDTTLMPFYGYKPYDDELIRNYSLFTTSSENPTWGEQCRGIKWGHESGATFPGYTTAFAGIIDRETMNGERGYMRELKRLADLDGSWWWWPYKVNTKTGDVVRLNCCGKCGWASGVFASMFITQVLGIRYDAPAQKLSFRPFSPGSDFTWKNAGIGSGTFDFSYEKQEKTTKVIVINRGKEEVRADIEIMLREGGGEKPDLRCNHWERVIGQKDGEFLKQKTICVDVIMKPDEEIIIIA